MKILVVDDWNEKIEKVVRAITESNAVSRDEIDVAYTVQDARELLRTNTYDLLVLDIVLPLRAGEPPRTESSVALMTELRDRATLKKPRHIIGLTAYDEAMRALQPVFAQQAWAIVKYAPNTTAWAEQIGRSVAYIERASSDAQDSVYGCDVCLVTALDSPEFEAILRMGWSWEPAEPVDDTTFVHRGEFRSQGKTYSAIAAHSPRVGMIPAALLTSKLVTAARPKYIAIGGICAGVNGKTNVGDILIADPCWDWQSGKHVVKNGEKEFEINPEQIPIANFVRSRWEQLRADRRLWGSIKEEWPEAPDTELRIRLGPSVSGSSVLADNDIVEQIKRQHRGLLGLEMEAYGVLSAARMAPYPRPTAFSCKSVCDLADEKKDDRWQAYAAYTSASALREFFEHYMAELAEIAG